MLALGWTLYNFITDYVAGNKADDISSRMDIGDGSPIVDSNMEMPTIEIDGVRFIGKIDIPSKNISLPVAGRYSESLLGIAPCRYYGSAYSDDMVIAGHNYVNHFGRLLSIGPGETVLFTDANGNEFEYTVESIEVIDPYDVEGMNNSEWDLTLFTCTLGGKTRLTVRCERVQTDKYIIQN